MHVHEDLLVSLTQPWVEGNKDQELLLYFIPCLWVDQGAIQVRSTSLINQPLWVIVVAEYLALMFYLFC